MFWTESVQMTNKILGFASLAEIATGASLLTIPRIVAHLLFGMEITGISVTLARFTGIALVGLGVACWSNNSALQPLYGMFTYSALVALYLATVGISGEAGILLWPAVAFHMVLCVLLLKSRSKEQKTPTT
jgi:hypothetical protein